MAGSGLTRFPVVERGKGGRLVGMIALTDLLVARTKNLEAEERRERVFALPRPFRSSSNFDRARARVIQTSIRLGAHEGHNREVR